MCVHGCVMLCRLGYQAGWQVRLTYTGKQSKSNVQSPLTLLNFCKITYSNFLKLTYPDDAHAFV